VTKESEKQFQYNYWFLRRWGTKGAEPPIILLLSQSFGYFKRWKDLIYPPKKSSFGGSAYFSDANLTSPIKNK
jgi:hypothetical protein